MFLTDLLSSTHVNVSGFFPDDYVESPALFKRKYSWVTESTKGDVVDWNKRVQCLFLQQKLPIQMTAIYRPGV